MNILFVCQYFYPEVFRGNDIVFTGLRRAMTCMWFVVYPIILTESFMRGY